MAHPNNSIAHGNFITIAKIVTLFIRYLINQDLISAAAAFVARIYRHSKRHKQTEF